MKLQRSEISSAVYGCLYANIEHGRGERLTESNERAVKASCACSEEVFIWLNQQRFAIVDSVLILIFISVAKIVIKLNCTIKAIFFVLSSPELVAVC